MLKKKYDSQISLENGKLLLTYEVNTSWILKLANYQERK